MFVVSVLLILKKKRKRQWLATQESLRGSMSKYLILNSGDQTSTNQNQGSSKSQTDAQENVDKSDVQSQSVRNDDEESTSASDVPEKDVISTLQSESVTRAQEITTVVREEEIVND